MKVVLIYGYDPAVAQQGGMEEIEEWMALDTKVKDQGILVYADGFQSADTARTVNVRNGQPTISEDNLTAPEAVAGFWVVDVPAIEDALSLAQEIPTARYGKVEVRPVVEWEG